MSNRSFVNTRRNPTSAVTVRAEHEEAVERALKAGKERKNRELVLSKEIVRTTALQAPNVSLKGHGAEVLSLQFNGNGETLATASFDKTIMLWNVFGEISNFHTFDAHKNAILQIVWSLDGDVGVFDAVVGNRVRRCKEHKGVVNTVDTARTSSDMFASGGDDGHIKLWDKRQKKSVLEVDIGFPVTCLCFDARGEGIAYGGIDNIIHQVDLRSEKELHELRLIGHTDTITGLSLSPDGTRLLTNSMDNSLRVWDLKPFSMSPNRLEKTFYGHSHGFEKNLLRCSWSTDGAKVSCGSTDHFVYIWEVVSEELVYKLPGHSGPVNEVIFHPDLENPIIASCSSDKTTIVGELTEE